MRSRSQNDISCEVERRLNPRQLSEGWIPIGGGDAALEDKDVRLLPKKFRLFISSTFSDFVQERDLLQTEVFPEVEIFCADHGYQFQAIDLRWGVNEEAQYDQRTIEVCLEELKACQSYGEPNFLILIGDRYGWMPLPSPIPTVTFQQIISLMTERRDREFVEMWYRLDWNQIPPAFFLRRREGEYLRYEAWAEVEERLRKIFHKTLLHEDPGAIHSSHDVLSSATEIEIANGLQGYLELSLNEIMKVEPGLNSNKFAFFRSISESHFLQDKDYRKTQAIKASIRSLLPPGNIYESNISDIRERPDLEEFKHGVLAFLKTKISTEIERRNVFSDLEAEIHSHQRFRAMKQQLFVGRATDLQTIMDYIQDQTKNGPLFVYGGSGQGKSSLMAAFLTEDIRIQAPKIFRFVGASPKSCNRNHLLRGILEEIDENECPDDLSFQNLCEKISQKLSTSNTPLLLCVDAIDQLIQEDHLFWVPRRLAPGVKVVLSLLSDPVYVSASRTFENAKHRFDGSCFYHLAPFSDGLALLKQGLAAAQRTATEDQFTSVLGNVDQPTPLYLTLCMDEMKKWSSDFLPKDLPADQLDAVKRHITDLSSLWYHHPLLVERTFSYFTLSGEGLSESDLLELLSLDEDFVRTVAPNTYYLNVRGGVPVAIWSRFYDYCRPFFLKRVHCGFQVLQLSHREFHRAVADLYDLRTHHQQLLHLIVLSTQKWQFLEFYKTRTGILFVDVLTDYQIRYQDMAFLEVVCKQVVALENRAWVTALVSYLDRRAADFDKAFDSRANATYQILAMIHDSTPMEWRSDEQLSDFYFRYGGYQYLHVSWVLGLDNLEKSTHYFEQRLSRAAEGSDEAIEINGAYSQVLGRMGEMAVREAKQQDTPKDQVEERVGYAIKFYNRSEPMLREMVEKYESDSECHRKLGVLYERMAVAYQVLDDEKQVRRFFELALLYKGRSYNPSTGKNAFAMRKLWITIASDYLDRGAEDEAKAFITEALDSVRPGELSESILENNQYKIEQLHKLYTYAIQLFGIEQYKEELTTIDHYYRCRGLSSEY